VHFMERPVQVVVVADVQSGNAARELAEAARRAFAFNKSVLRLKTNQAVAENLPPALAATIPRLPGLNSGASFAVLCSGSACQPPIARPDELQRALDAALRKDSLK